MTTTWTDADSQAASLEGWDIWDSEGSQNGPWQIQKFDDTEEAAEQGFGILAEDTDSWVLVRTQAAAGSPLHQRALAFLAEHNPTEYEAIMAWREDEAGIAQITLLFTAALLLAVAGFVVWASLAPACADSYPPEWYLRHLLAMGPGTCS